MSDLEQRLDDIAGKVARVEQTEQQRRQAQVQGAFIQRAASVEKAVTDAEKALAEAYDNGDGDEIAKAQRILTEATVKKERFTIEVENMRARGGEKDATNLNKWKARHESWYGVDAEMTKASHEIDRQIKAAGTLSVGSQQYFDAIDRAMSQRFPDRLGGTPPTFGGSRGGVPNTSTGGRIDRSVAEGYRRMGINIDDPKVAERMVKNRQLAVQKGILPDQAVRGAIVTR